METDIDSLKGDIRRLMVDITLIKNVLLNETELTVWAKKELEIARGEDEREYTS